MASQNPKNLRDKVVRIRRALATGELQIDSEKLADVLIEREPSLRKNGSSPSLPSVVPPPGKDELN